MKAPGKSCRRPHTVAFVPALGFVEAVAAPVLALRLRGRGGGRYAGLRILAKD